MAASSAGFPAPGGILAPIPAGVESGPQFLQIILIANAKRSN
jgi:hypothetical protein